MTAQGEETLRFEFGENWSRFLSSIDETRVVLAEQSLKRMLRTESMAGKRFLDIGSGSGLFSLAARRLGATVHSFDYDPYSVTCTQHLRARFFPNDPNWTVERGSILDNSYLQKLGPFDVVYSWGVLHHTGNMPMALENAAAMVSPEGGKLFIAIYNDQGRLSALWRAVKRAYNRLPEKTRLVVVVPSALCLCLPSMLKNLARLEPSRTWRRYGSERGMSLWRDVIDWVGGYPFEVAKPEVIIEFCRLRGMALDVLTTVGGGHGCNEYVFVRG